MPIRIVPVNAGRVTSRDPSLFGDGELSLAQDAYYKPSNPGVFKIPGRVEFNSSAEPGAIVGGRFLQYDGGTSRFVILQGTNYRIATAGLTGAFSDLVTGLAGTATSLDSAHYNNIHYLLNGVDRNRAVPSDAVARFQGMVANTQAPQLQLNGALTGFTLSTGKTIKYWIEERVKSGSTILRRNAELGSTVVTLTGTGVLVKPRILKPGTLANSDATHWALYATATDGAFPVGAEIGEAAIGSGFIDDTRTGTDPALPSGALYSTVAVSIAGITQIVAKNGPPPIATTGDVFEDSLVLNSVSDKSLVFFSFVDEPEVFPAFNFIRVGDTKEEDEVVVVRTLGEVCVVLLRDSAWRLNTLPRPEDASFQTERVKGQIHGAHGCVGPKAADVFSFGDGIRLAYVSPYGVLVTDGYRWDVLTDDVDWEAEVNISQLSKCVLRNNPRFYRLELSYAPIGETRNTRTMFLHYHPSHAKTGAGGGFRAKATWPIRRDANDAFVANLSGERIMFSVNENGKVYQHDTGNSEPVVSGGIQFAIRTGDIYPAGIGGEATLRRLYTHHQAGANQDCTLRVVQRAAGQTDEALTDQIDLDFREGTPSHRQALAEAFQLGAENSDTLGSIGIDFFAMDVQPAGRAGGR